MISLCLVAGLGLVAAANPKIDTIVVLMEENRAFDHMLGWMARGGPQGDTRIDGVFKNSQLASQHRNISQTRKKERLAGLVGASSQLPPAVCVCRAPPTVECRLQR